MIGHGLAEQEPTSHTTTTHFDSSQSPTTLNIARPQLRLHPAPIHIHASVPIPNETRSPPIASTPATCPLPKEKEMAVTWAGQEVPNPIYTFDELKVSLLTYPYPSLAFTAELGTQGAANRGRRLGSPTHRTLGRVRQGNHAPTTADGRSRNPISGFVALKWVREDRCTCSKPTLRTSFGWCPELPGAWNRVGDEVMDA